jgi:enterochelin esterase-like enzyme
MRSVEDDTASETYTRYLLEEVLPEIGKTVKLRQDAYSRAIIGQNSGGTAGFNAAHLKSDQFSWIGSLRRCRCRLNIRLAVRNIPCVCAASICSCR